MATFIKIREVNRKANGHLYLRADQWPNRGSHERGDPPLRTTTYETNIKSQRQRIIKNNLGHLKVIGGGFIDPSNLKPEDPEPAWEKETFTIDINPLILAGIEKSFESMEAQGLTGDYSADRELPLFKNDLRIGDPLQLDPTLTPHSVVGLDNAEIER